MSQLAYYCVPASLTDWQGTQFSVFIHEPRTMDEPRATNNFFLIIPFSLKQQLHLTSMTKFEIYIPEKCLHRVLKDTR